MRDSVDAPRPPGGTPPLGPHEVARVGYGAMQLERHHADRRRAVALLRRAIELGVDDQLAVMTALRDHPREN